MQGLGRAFDIQETRIEPAEPFHVPGGSHNDLAPNPPIRSNGNAFRPPTSYCWAAGVSTLKKAPCGSANTADRPTDGMPNGWTGGYPHPGTGCTAVAPSSATASS